MAAGFHMAKGPSASFPLSVAQRSGGVWTKRLVRVVLGVWAGTVYVIYWLGYLGWR